MVCLVGSELVPTSFRCQCLSRWKFWVGTRTWENFLQDKNLLPILKWRWHYFDVGFSQKHMVSTGWIMYNCRHNAITIPRRDTKSCWQMTYVRMHFSFALSAFSIHAFSGYQFIVLLLNLILFPNYYKPLFKNFKNHHKFLNFIIQINVTNYFRLKIVLQFNISY